MFLQLIKKKIELFLLNYLIEPLTYGSIEKQQRLSGMSEKKNDNKGREQNQESEGLDVENSPSLKSWGEPADLPKKNLTIECGWGRLLFAHTFASSEKVAQSLREEGENKRDLALYVRDPQVVVANAPQGLFIDPSYTFRLPLDNYKPLKKEKAGFTIRPIDTKKDIESVNRIYQTRNMMEVEPEFLRKSYNKRKYLTYWVAVDNDTEEVIASCMGIDHRIAFDDPENGASLWCLAVDPQASHPAIGIHMVQHIAEHYIAEGRTILDLSVMHSNKEAISLYEKIGFVQIPVFCVKNKNAINEKLYTGPESEEIEEMSPYSMIIINEARKRGIRVDVLDPIDNYFGLSSGGTSIVCRESLTDLTSSIAMSRCNDRRTTARTLQNAGLHVPNQHLACTPAKNQAFMEEHGSVVVKPCIRIQSAGTTVNVQTKEDLQKAVKHARKVNSDVMLEEMVDGKDMRVLVIDFQVVAAATRKPPIIVGNGEHTILELIEKQSRRREQATQGENKIPVDKELSNTILDAGYSLEDILPKGRELQVRKASSLHFGGTVHDVTDELHPELIDAAVQAAYALDTPVVGLDFIISDPSEPKYVIVEANERPHLLNHEPQPTAERFIDFLFPQSALRES